MHRGFRRLALLSCCSVACTAALAPPSSAATSVTTLPANFVTTNSATLHGSVDPGGQAVSWTFEYGALSAPQASTPYQTIPAGQTLTNYEAATLFRLRPNTTYLFRLVAYSGIGTNYQEKQPGSFLSFRTKPTGRLRLFGRRLRVSRGVVDVRLKCASKIACKGHFTVLARTSAGTRKTCARRSFTMRPGRQRSFFPGILPACRSLVNRRPGHVLGAQFTSATTTGQAGVNRKIKLIG